MVNFFDLTNAYVRRARYLLSHNIANTAQSPGCGFFRWEVV